MQELSAQLQTWRLALESFHPLAPATVLLVAIFGSQYLVRRFIPGVWEWMANLPFPGGIHKPLVALARKAWQAIPSAALGAFAASFAYGEDPYASIIGAILGLVAPIGHELAKANKSIPYRGGKPPAADPK
jgi:hypothetical protein